MSDELADEIKSLEQACQELPVTLVPGSFEREKMPTIRWDTSGPDEWRAYLALAKSSGSILVVLEKYEFDEEAFEYLRPEVAETNSDDEPEADEEAPNGFDFEEEWESLKSKYKKFYASLHAYALHWTKDGICHTYERNASWYEKLIEDVEELKDKLEAATAESEEEVPELTNKELEEIASILARDELFQKATNQGTRRFALKKRFPEIVEDHSHQIPDIIEHAKGIFELEIKPELEKALDKQIGDLSKEGLSKEEVARKLRLPISRVKKAL